MARRRSYARYRRWVDQERRRDEEIAARKVAEERAASALRELSAQQRCGDAMREDGMKRVVELTADINSLRSKLASSLASNQELRVEINGLRSKSASQHQDALGTLTAMQAQHICREELQWRKAAEKMSIFFGRETDPSVQDGRRGCQAHRADEVHAVQSGPEDAQAQGEHATAGARPPLRDMRRGGRRTLGARGDGGSPSGQ